MNNTAIGKEAALLATDIRNCVFIGYGAGRDITSGEGIIIIGDGIHNLSTTYSNTVYIGDKIRIGATIFGRECNLIDILSIELDLSSAFDVMKKVAQDKVEEVLAEEVNKQHEE